MKIEEPNAMRQIHKIRIKLWEEESGLSPQERIKRSNALLAQFVKKHHLEDRLVSIAMRT